MTVLIDGEYEVPAPLVLESLMIMSVARERRYGWSSDSVIDVCIESHITVAHPKLLADSADSIDSVN